MKRDVVTFQIQEACIYVYICMYIYIHFGFVQILFGTPKSTAVDKYITYKTRKLLVFFHHFLLYFGDAPT